MPVPGLAAYDSQNVFARILRGEIPCRRVMEDEHVLAFHDIAPNAPVHVLVIPKGPYVSFADFSARASDAEVLALFRAAGRIASALDLDQAGYRVLSNMGLNAGQEVPHFHLHLFGGGPLGPMIVPPRD